MDWYWICLCKALCKRNLIGKLINLAILNSLANYTYTHQLLKCKVERVIYPMINDLLIEQEVLKLQIKEHKDFNLVMEGLEGLVNSSYRWMYSYKSKSNIYSCSTTALSSWLPGQLVVQCLAQ